MRRWFLMLLLLLGCWAGCGTTKWSDTSRTATEQLLISDSVDRAVSQLDFRAIAGKKVFLDDSYVKSITDTAYLISSLRQHILASGAILREKREEADYIVEVRAGAVGTDRHDLLFGIPQTTVPMLMSASVSSTTIPEIAIAKRTDQRAVAKVAVFAYNRQTGRPIWQSGVVPAESKAKAVWIAGAGPFQQGTIYEGTKFAGSRLSIPLIDPMVQRDADHPTVSVAEQARFSEPGEDRMQGGTAQSTVPAKAGGGATAPATAVIQASHNNVGGQVASKPTAPAGPPSSPAHGNRAAPQIPPAITALPATAPAATASQGLELATPAPVPASSLPASSLPADPAPAPAEQFGPYPSTDPFPFYRR